MKFRNGLTLTTAVAAALMVAACSSNPQPDQPFTTDQPTAVCTDGSGNRVDDDLCDDDDDRGGGGGFAFMYLNTGSHVPAYGSKVHGGSKAKAPGSSYSSSKSVATARGGFGGSARGGGGFSSGS